MYDIEGIVYALLCLSILQYDKHKPLLLMTMMMMIIIMMIMMNCLCSINDQQKAFNLISSRDHCQRSSPSWIFDTPRAELKIIFTWSWSTHSEEFHKEGLLKNFTEFTGKHLCWSLSFDKVADLHPQSQFFKITYQGFQKHLF